MSVLVVVEHDRGVIADASLEAFAFAATLASRLGVGVEALLIGSESAALADRCAASGATTVHHVDHAVLTDYGPDAYGTVVASATELLAPTAIVASGSDRGNEVLAFAAAELDLPFVANCLDVSLDTDDDEWELTRVQWGGSLIEVARLASSTPILTVAPHAVEPVGLVEASAEPHRLEIELPASVSETIVQDRVVLSEGVTLATAPVVVGGGRGVGSAEGFEVLEVLARKLGGVVGCSRAVTNNGWRPHSDQVGQTGTRIAPQLYIACGISGAIQHWVGAKSAKKILAINTDAAANMVVKADYAIIGDLFEVVPAITAEL